MRRRRRLVVIVTIAALGCASHRLRTRTAPTPAWQAEFAYAQQAIALGRYGQADSSLLAFSIAHPGTHDGAESQFWRALFALDPRNDHHSAADAIRALTAYASYPQPRDHDLEAEVLRRTATALTALSEATAQAASRADSARTEADSVRTEADSARLARASRDRTREEVQRLRDSLDKVDSELTETNQELDRIKKRLTAPKP